MREPRNDREAMVLLETFKRLRDLEARNLVGLYVYNKWLPKALKRFSSDPYQDRDDIANSFFEGILGGLEKVDGRGIPLYHIAVRGFWQVGSVTRVPAVRKHMLNADISELWDPANGDASPARSSSPDFADAVDRQIDAEGVVRKARETLANRALDTLEIIVAGKAGDPMDLGFNQRVAKELGVSEQRASQIMGKMREDLEKIGVES